MDDRTATSTNVQVVNNYVRDVNMTSNGAGDNGTNGQNGCCAIGIYFDEGTSNVTVTGNIVAGIKSACFLINDADNDVITGNICDLADSEYQSIVAYGGGTHHVTEMTGNVFAHNIVISGSAGSGSGYSGSSLPPTPMTISDNAYYNYVGSAITSSGTGGAGSDSNPVYEDPQLSGWTYALATGSPVLESPVEFVGITGGWGPSGFAIPQTGTPPSCPH